jgi:hypothetical protein
VEPEGHVDEEALAVAPLLRQDTVPAEAAQAAQGYAVQLGHARLLRSGRVEFTHAEQRRR